MSFFGFETTLPRDQQGSRGVFEQHDPFAGLGDAANADDALDFEQTYDGLGNQLNETGDTFNDDTFGDSMPATRQAGRDFDFAGETAKIRDTLMEEQTLHHARMPMQQAMQMDDDAKAIMSNSPVLVPGEEGLADIRIVEAINKAAKSGNRVTL